MATNFCENLRNVQRGRNDWKVKVRIIREWRGITKTRIIFKGYNLLLLDNKNCRMHAFVPAALSEKMSKQIQEGKIYLIKNFQVKDYTEADKFRPVQMDRQIIFNSDTKVKEIEETEIFIPQNSFDLFEYGDLKQMTTQQLYLTDVIGILEKKPKINHIPNKQKNLKFKISAGRKKINVTFWDSFAEDFEKALTNDLEEPLILIIASGRISSWKDELDICNYSPTRFYLNYDHHSVAKLRKMIKETNFCQHQFAVRKKPLQQCTIAEIKNLPVDFIEEEVFCKVTIKCVEETDNWKRHVCTSCYTETELKDKKHLCGKCNRSVPEPLKRFHISTVAQDETGGLEIILKDREVQSLLHQNVEDVELQDNSFPKEIKALQGQNYIIRLRITADNIAKRDFDYVATGIIRGVTYQNQPEDDMESLQNTHSFNAEPSGSSFHLDQISQLNENRN